MSIATFLPDKYLNGEPGVADALDVEEGVVRIGTVLVQGPRSLHDQSQRNSS